MEYARDGYYLPHAASEIDFHEQYGLAYNLHALGLGTEAAIHCSEGAFLVAIAAGLVIARRWWTQQRYEIALFGIGSLTLLASPFLHITQIAYAIPAAIAIYANRPSRPAGLATLLLAFPVERFRNSGRRRAALHCGIHVHRASASKASADDRNYRRDVRDRHARRRRIRCRRRELQTSARHLRDTRQPR